MFLNFARELKHKQMTNMYLRNVRQCPEAFVLTNYRIYMKNSASHFMQIFIIVKNAVLYILYIYIISKFKLALSGYDEIYLIMMAVLALVLCYIKSNSI